MKMKPKIRFKGFDGEWYKVKLGNIFCERNESNINGEMLSVTQHNGIIKASENGRYDNSNSDKSNYKVVKVGDIAYNSMRMWQGASGYSPYEGIVSPAYTVIIPQEGIYSPFFAYLFKNENIINTFRLHSQGLTSDTWNLKYPAFSKIEVLFPEDAETKEQQTIASFLSSFDRQICLQTQRLEKLKQIKAGSLQAMFPQEGETVPKVRFKGFKGEWKKVKLEEIAVFSKGQGYSKSDLKEEGYPIVLYGRMYTKYQFSINEVDTFVNPKDFSIISEGNEVIMPASGETPEDIARASAVIVKNIILGGDLNIMRFDLTNYSTPFIALTITYGKTHYDLSRCAQGKSVVHLHNGEISKATIMLPSLEEQQVITSYFTSLDRQISLHSQRLEKLKQIKAACLDKMFV